MFSKMVQEAGLHLNEGQAHDELGKNNPGNTASLLTLCDKGRFAGEMSVPKQQKFYTDDIRSL